MSEKTRSKTDLLGLVSFAFFLIALGAIFATVPDLSTKIVEFFQSFRIEEVYPGTSFVAPIGDQSAVYGAAYTFSIIFGISQIIVLTARFLIRDGAGRKADSFTGITFWFGAAWGFNSLAAGGLDWFIFLGWIAVLVGISITIRSAVALATRERVKADESKMTRRG